MGFLADANPPGRPSLFSLFPSPSYPSLIPLERMTSQFFISRARVWTCSGKSDTYRGDISHPVFLPWSHTACQLITLRTHLLGYHHCSRVKKKIRKKPRKKPNQAPPILPATNTLSTASHLPHTRLRSPTRANLPTFYDAVGAPHQLCPWGSWFSPVTACPNLVFLVVEAARQPGSQSNHTSLSSTPPGRMHVSPPSCTQPRNSSQGLPTKHISPPLPFLPTPSPHRRPIPRLRTLPLPCLVHPHLRRAPCTDQLPLRMPLPTPNLLVRSLARSLLT